MPVQLSPAKNYQKVLIGLAPIIKFVNILQNIFKIYQAGFVKELRSL
jgi:hypothetical protein